MNLRDQLCLFFYIAILVISSFLNGLVLIAVCKNRSLLFKRRFAILISLAIADFLKIIPLTIQVAAVILGPGSKNGSTACFYASTTGLYLIIVTVAHLAVESINRLVSIVWPLRYELFTNSKFFIAHFPVMWFLPCVGIVFVPYAVFEGNYNSYRALRMRMFSCTLDVLSEHVRTVDGGSFVWYASCITVIFFAIPFVVMGVSYTIIFKISLKHITEIKRIEDRMSKFRQQRNSSISEEIASIHDHASPPPQELEERVDRRDSALLEQNCGNRVQHLGTENGFFETGEGKSSHGVALGSEMADRLNNIDGGEKLNKDHVRIHSVGDTTLSETSTDRDRDNYQSEDRPQLESRRRDMEELRAGLRLDLEKKEYCRSEGKDQTLIVVASNEENVSPQELDRNENTRKQEIQKQDEESVNRDGREVRAESIEFLDKSSFGIDTAARSSLVTHQREVVISPVSFQEMNAGPYEFIKEFSVMAAWAETLRRKAVEEEHYSFSLAKFHNLIKEEIKSRKREMKLARTLGGLVGAFLLFYLPLIIVAWNNLATDKHPTEASFDLGRGLVAWAFLNSLLNPVIYGRRVAEMRRAVDKVVRRFKSRVQCSKRT